MSRSDPQFNLRIPASLKADVEKAAQHNKRSSTAEIIARLEITFDLDERLEELKFNGSLEHIGDFIDSLVQNYNPNPEPHNTSHSRTELLTEMFKETTRRIGELESQTQPASVMDQVELEHERETAKHLRHAIARALAVEAVIRG